MQTINREQLIDALTWVGDKTLKTSVLVGTPANKYSNQELIKLVNFSKAATIDHIIICGDIQPSDNLVVIDKEHDCRWLRKRTSWVKHAHSVSLNHAIKMMQRR